MPIHTQSSVAEGANQTRLTFTPTRDVWVQRIGVVNVSQMSNYGLAVGSSLDDQTIPWLKVGRSSDINEPMLWDGFIWVPVGVTIAGYIWPTASGNRVRFWVDYL